MQPLCEMQKIRSIVDFMKHYCSGQPVPRSEQDNVDYGNINCTMLMFDLFLKTSLFLSALTPSNKILCDYLGHPSSYHSMDPHLLFVPSNMR